MQGTTEQQSGIDLDKLRHTLFHLWRGKPNADGSRWLGSAFAIGPHLCLTATHVVKGIEPADFFLVGEGCYPYQKISNVEPNPDRDVALLSIDLGAPGFKQFYTLSSTPLSHYIGNPEILYSCGYVAEDETVQPLPVNSLQYNGAVTAYAFTHNIKQGKSGGCLLNADQQVVGVVFAGDSEKGNHYVIAVDSFRPWISEFLLVALNDHKLTHDQQLLIDCLQSDQTIDESLLKSVSVETPANLTSYFLRRYAYRGRSKTLNEKFVDLRLLEDKGQQSEQERLMELPDFKAGDLKTILDRRSELAFIVIGRPGNGKTVLLHHLELALCKQALLDGARPAANGRFVPFYLELNQFPPKNSPDMEPFDWIVEQWQSLFRDLPPLPELMKNQTVVLLLDALNEMQIQPQQYDPAIRQWRKALQHLDEHYPNTRVFFSCRTADYSGVLSSNELQVPQVRFQDLDDTIVEEYLCKQLGPEAGSKLAQVLLTMPGLELRTPYYLELAVEYFRETGAVPSGASQLVASLIWLSLIREFKKEQPSSSLAIFLSSRDQKKLSRNQWRSNPHQLPSNGLLLQGMVELGWTMQRSHGGGKQIFLTEDEISQSLLPLCQQDDDQADALQELMEQLDFLVEDGAGNGWKFSHQLLQEYLAAQRLADLTERDNDNEALNLLHKPWKQGYAMPDFQKTVSQLAVADPLPDRQSSGWEETALHACAIHKDPWKFIEQIKHKDLVLAARCVQHPELNQAKGQEAITEAQKDKLRHSLLELCQNPVADLRARIEAGIELGNLGDHRFNKVKGKEAEYIEPPLVQIPAGIYPIGSEHGDADERPVHQYELECFKLGQYPITNGEWRCFMDAGGYEDPRWWQTQQAKLWQRGELEDTDNIQRYLNRYAELLKDFEGTCDRIGASDLGRDQYAGWLENWPTQEAFSDAVHEKFKPQKIRQPSQWLNPRFNNPNQPVVGVCWYEAMAYCHWLSFQSGQDFRLPSEAQWKAAARGNLGSRFPWGNQPTEINHQHPLANCDELHIRRTTPVGMFAEGETQHWPEVIHDLSGNVWEWNSSLDWKYPIQANDGRDSPDAEGRIMLSGGAWSNLTSVARAAYRSSNHPALRNGNIGFRVVCCPPSLGTDH